jgi:hypothetical protein
VERCLACEADSVGTVKRSRFGSACGDPRLIICIVCGAETSGNRRLLETTERDFVYSDCAYKVNSLSRTWRTTKRWVIRGSRLLSRFPVPIRDTTKIAL